MVNSAKMLSRRFHLSVLQSENIKSVRCLFVIDFALPGFILHFFPVCNRSCTVPTFIC